MCDSEGDEGSSSHGVWETRVVTGPEVESGALEEGKEKEGREGEGGGREEERREDVIMSQRSEGEGKTNHHWHMCHSEQTCDYTHVGICNVDHTHLSNIVDLVGLSLSVSYHVTVHSTLDHWQG